MLRPLRDSVLFVFTDEVSDGMFIDQTESGIYLGKNIDSSTQSARWGVIAATGPDVKLVKTGAKVLIGALRWTEGFKIDNTKLWKTVEGEILAVDTTFGIKLTPPKNLVFFIPDKKSGKVTESAAGVFVVESTSAGEEMNWATVKAVGPDVNNDDITVGSRILIKRDIITKILKTADGELWHTTEDAVFAVEEME